MDNTYIRNNIRKPQSLFYPTLILFMAQNHTSLKDLCGTWFPHANPTSISLDRRLGSYLWSTDVSQTHRLATPYRKYDPPKISANDG